MLWASGAAAGWAVCQKEAWQAKELWECKGITQSKQSPLGKHRSPHKAWTKRAIFQTYSLNLIYTKIHEKYFSKLTVKTVFLNEKLLISSELRDELFYCSISPLLHRALLGHLQPWGLSKTLVRITSAKAQKSAAAFQKLGKATVMEKTSCLYQQREQSLHGALPVQLLEQHRPTDMLSPSHPANSTCFMGR